MTVDSELQAWREAWSAQRSALPDLTARVRRQSRFMRWMLAAEILITVVMGGGTVALAVRSGATDMRVLAAATWVFLLAAWAFGLWNRSGAWKPVSLSTSAYVEVSVRRCQGAIRGAIFGMILFVVEMVFCVGWIYNREQSAAFLTSPAMLAVWAGSVVFFIATIRYRRRKSAELASLLKVASSLEGGIEK